MKWRRRLCKSTHDFTTASLIAGLPDLPLLYVSITSPAVAVSERQAITESSPYGVGRDDRRIKLPTNHVIIATEANGDIRSRGGVARLAHQLHVEPLSIGRLLPRDRRHALCVNACCWLKESFHKLYATLQISTRLKHPLVWSQSDVVNRACANAANAAK